MFPETTLHICIRVGVSPVPKTQPAPHHCLDFPFPASPPPHPGFHIPGRAFFTHPVAGACVLPLGPSVTNMDILQCEAQTPGF